MEQYKNSAKVYTGSLGGELRVSMSDSSKIITATNNRAQYYAEQSKKYSELAKQYKDDALFYLNQNSDVTYDYIENIKNDLVYQINTKQEIGNYALKTEIPVNVSELANDSKYVNETALSDVINSHNELSETVADELAFTEQLAKDVSAKVNLDGSNAEFPYITETYKNGDSWYRVYSDGWCEQGGLVTTVATNVTVTFLNPFADANYSVVTTVDSGMADCALTSNNMTQSSVVGRIGSYNTKTTTSFRINDIGGYQPTSSGLGAVCWVARGYIA